MYCLESPFSPGPISIPTLVATITLLRFPVRFSQLPMMVSDSPPLCPGTQREYISAVSMKLNPAATNASSIRNDVFSSAVQPNTLVPRQSGETLRFEAPSLRVFMDWLSPFPHRCPPECSGRRIKILSDSNECLCSVHNYAVHAIGCRDTSSPNVRMSVAVQSKPCRDNSRSSAGSLSRGLSGGAAPDRPARSFLAPGKS